MRLALSVEAFNVLNRTQVTGVNTRLYIVGGTATASTLTFDPAFRTIAAAATDSFVNARFNWGRDLSLSIENDSRVLAKNQTDLSFGLAI